MKDWLPEISKFGTPNHKIIDTQISLLKSEIDLDDLDEGDLDDNEENEIYRGAEEAQEWLDEDSDEDLFEVR